MMERSCHRGSAAGRLAGGEEEAAHRGHRGRSPWHRIFSKMECPWRSLTPSRVGEEGDAALRRRRPQAEALHGDGGALTARGGDTGRRRGLGKGEGKEELLVQF